MGLIHVKIFYYDETMQCDWNKKKHNLPDENVPEYFITNSNLRL